MKTPPQRVQPLCEGCGRVLRIKHLLVECTRYDGHRVRLLRDQGLRSVLPESEGTTKRIIEFFREIDLFDEIWLRSGKNGIYFLTTFSLEFNWTCPLFSREIGVGCGVSRQLSNVRGIRWQTLRGNRWLILVQVFHLMKKLNMIHNLVLLLESVKL
jgi:hypothetical protein